MQLTTETLNRLRLILKEDFGIEANDQELNELAFNLLGYFNTLLEYHNEDQKGLPVQKLTTL